MDWTFFTLCIMIGLFWSSFFLHHAELKKKDEIVGKYKELADKQEDLAQQASLVLFELANRAAHLTDHLIAEDIDCNRMLFKKQEGNRYIYSDSTAPNTDPEFEFSASVQGENV